jgi:hypothetical protein
MHDATVLTLNGRFRRKHFHNIEGIRRLMAVSQASALDDSAITDCGRHRSFT